MLSAGVVVVRNTPEAPLFLLLRAYNYWDFPKGLVEEGEDPLQAARREAKEEAGIDDLDFKWGLSYRETEPYGKGKVARYYLATTSADEISIPSNPLLGRPEHHEARWMSYEEAKGKLVPRVQEILQWAYSFVNSSEKSGS